MGKTMTAVTMKDTMLWDPNICTLPGVSLNHVIATDSLRSSSFLSERIAEAPAAESAVAD